MGVGIQEKYFQEGDCQNHNLQTKKDAGRKKSKSPSKLRDQGIGLDEGSWKRMVLYMAEGG